ncbi:MAG: prepilin-type N-terminal cleavage/methylation domain-containing protein [bacterium]|nr:prepilin-type N-terminal cleavage/methylation domain-containing protein [bacterium]
MKLNNKGISIIELIISISLISVVMLFLYNLLSNVTFEKDDDYFASLNQANRIEIISNIEDTLMCYSINSYEIKGDNELKLKYADNESFIVNIDRTNNKVSFNKGTTTIGKWTIKNASIGEITCNDVGDGIVTTKYTQCTIPIYTTNINDIENNNNTIDDITFTFKKEV